MKRSNQPPKSECCLQPGQEPESLACAGGLAIGLPAVTSGRDQGLPKSLGVARGIHPGRVVWVHDPEVAWSATGFDISPT
jgi:hypothetical protein